MGRGVNTGALSPVGGIGEIRMRANLRKIVAYKEHGGQIRNRRLYCQRSRPVPKAVFRAGRRGQWVYHLVALVREPKGDHRGGGADGQGVWWQSLRVADG